MNTVLMLAGGVGTRMGANIPKQFIKIKGKPIIAYTLDMLEKNEGSTDRVRKLLKLKKDKSKTN